MEQASSTLQYLNSCRLYGRPLRNQSKPATSAASYVKNRINTEYSGMHRLIDELRAAIDHSQWTEISRCVASLVTVLLQNEGTDSSFNVPPKVKQQRTMFVSLGGIDQLLRILEPPLMVPDSRNVTELVVKRRAELWNEVFVMLREIFFSTPLLADKVATNQHIVFLFTMLHHSCIFENSMNLLEEILASRNETFNLAEVPELYSLVGQFSTRQMAHFCRVLALLLFESEDRQIMEASKVLKSFELLHLRKDRMTRACFNIVELNQSLVIGLPGILQHLVTILKILNFGPTVSEYVKNNVSGHVPLSSDILSYISGRSGNSEWRHFERLNEIASSRVGSNGVPSNVTAMNGWGTTAPAATAAPSTPTPVTSSARSAPNISSIEAEDEAFMHELLGAFSGTRNSGDDGGEAQYDPISSILSVMQVAHSIGIAPSGMEHYDGVMQMLIQMSNPDMPITRRQRHARAVPAPGADDTAYYNSYTAAEARHELQFHAMVLAPHQVEVLFVICTLLSGRRKIQVQNMMSTYGVPEVLWQMNIRMSWNAPAYEGPNPYEHIHGPSCECNPESALRVQFLRLVHNFYDRDFMNNPLKLSMLSEDDIIEIEDIRKELSLLRTRAEAVDVFSHDGTVVLPRRTGCTPFPLGTGLLGKITQTLMNQSRDSVYQFWLCSCVECYLRGQSEEVRVYFARSGLLEHFVRHVTNHTSVRQTESVLQTSFDLIGEIVRYNPGNFELLDVILSSSSSGALTAADAVSPSEGNLKPSSTSDQEASLLNFADVAGDDYYGLKDLVTESALGDSFSSFIKVVMDNIIDSNVFLRSLYLSIEEINASNIKLWDSKKLNHKNQSWQRQRRTKIICNAENNCNVAFGTPNALPVAADTTYLTHSWYQISPVICSGKEINSACDKLGLSTSSSTAECPDKGKVSVGHSRSPGRMMSALGSGLIGAFRGLMGQKKNNNNSGSTSDKDMDRSSSVDSADILKDQGIDNSGSRSDSSFHTAAELDLLVDTICFDKENPRCDTEAIATSEGENEWLLPPEIQRITSFLLNSKSRILLRLMSTVTIRSINHENICCINTALVILLFDHRRGILAETLAEVRQLAKLFGKCHCSLSNVPSGVATMSEGNSVTGLGDSSANNVSVASSPTPVKDKHSLESIISQSRDGCMFCKPYYSVGVANEGERGSTTEVGSKVFLNFRQLLWYWTEYYFRRGRDRLSLEFSTHIPFSCWKDVVETLCRDNGASTALLTAPVHFPQSPYAPLPPLARSILRGNIFEEQRI